MEIYNRTQNIETVDQGKYAENESKADKRKRVAREHKGWAEMEFLKATSNGYEVRSYGNPYILTKGPRQI